MEAPDPRAGTAGPPRRLNVPAAGPADGAPGGGGVHMVVVHHDRPDTCAHTVAAFEALAEVTSVCVVDSSSHPAASGRLRELLPGAEIIDAGGNVGFGPGANLGLRRWLRHGSGPWVGVAPHDAVPAPDAIARILHETEARPDAGLVSAEFGPEFALVPVFDKVMGGFYRAAPRGSGWQDVDYPHGTLLLARRELLEDIGLFDERYFAYCEEVDLGLRARDAGWAVGLVWGAVVVNGRLPSRLLADYLQLRNTLLLVHSRQGPREVRARVILALAAMIARPFRRPPSPLHRRRAPVDLRRATVHLRLERRALLDYRHRRFGPPPADVVAMARRYEATVDRTVDRKVDPEVDPEVEAAGPAPTTATARPTGP
jgi:N-acetylglucosaminyl-diphospho-decaprenol L-rhamnosyltransferase